MRIAVIIMEQPKLELVPKEAAEDIISNLQLSILSTVEGLSEVLRAMINEGSLRDNLDKTLA